MCFSKHRQVRARSGNRHLTRRLGAALRTDLLAMSLRAALESESWESQIPLVLPCSQSAQLGRWNVHLSGTFFTVREISSRRPLNPKLCLSHSLLNPTTHKLHSWFLEEGFPEPAGAQSVTKSLRDGVNLG